MHGSPRLNVLACAIALLLGAGCAAQPEPWDQSGDGAELIMANQRAADRLYRGLDENSLSPQPILVAGFADEADLSRSSVLGRTIAAHMTAQLQRLEVATVLLPLTLPLFVERVPGEHVISPEVKAIAVARGFERIALGTYAVGEELVYVHARIVDAANSRILASYEYPLLLTADVARLLAQP